jgi:Ca-activated chloride channel homolog
MRQDFYLVLGVPPNASADEIRQAFRQRVRQYHPDASPDDPNAPEHIKVINEAYKVLGTPQLRAAYDKALRIVSPQSAGPLSQTHIPVAPGGLSAHQATQNRARVTLAPDLNPYPHTTHSPPMLALGYIPAQPSVTPPHEMTRFYLLSEIGASRESAVIDPQPLDLALVIDRSGTMRGEKIAGVKLAVRNILDRLHLDDLLTIVLFDDFSEVVADGETVQGRPGIEAALDNIHVKGSTSISKGLEGALERLAARQNRTKIASVVLLTDGMTRGDDDRCKELAAQARDMGISITTLGLGLEWNRDLLDKLAAISGGSSNFAEKPADVQPIFEDVIARLRATLAAGMRMSFEPAPGVRIARATRVAPDIAEGFGVPTDALANGGGETEQVTLDLGALVGRPEVETAVVVWEVMLTPGVFSSRNGAVELGRLSAQYWAPQLGGGHGEHLEQLVQLPVNPQGDCGPIHQDVRLALELITAYRLQAQADSLTSAGKTAEAIKRMNTAADRLGNAGSRELADDARRAARELAGDNLTLGVTETLRAKYGTKSIGVFHRLRRRLHAHAN